MAMSNEEALKLVLAGQPQYPPRATHPEDAHDDERDYRTDCQKYEAAKQQIQSFVTSSSQEHGRHIPD
jgi:hypothetical protein